MQILAPMTETISLTIVPFVLNPIRLKTHPPTNPPTHWLYEKRILENLQLRYVAQDEVTLTPKLL